MSRRRPTLTGYLRRRWRIGGAILVLMLGALLVLAVTDRGHDPFWRADVDDIAQVAFAPDGSAAFALLLENGTVSRALALDAATGGSRWESSLPDDIRGAILAAGAQGAAVATDFPNAFLTVYGADGAPDWQVHLEGNPVALVVEGDNVALALNAPHNPVLVFERDYLLRTFHHAAPVRALDMEKGLIAVGSLAGEIVVRDLAGREVLNETLAMSPRGLRLAADGTALVVGGYGATPADPRGHVAFLDIGGEKPIRWQQDTPVGVGLVDIDDAGLVALAVEESPPSAVLHVYEGSTGATRWTRLLAGSVSRDDAGGFGGAALSPDAAYVAVGTLRGNVQLFGAGEGDEVWTYRAGGVSVLAFAEEEPSRLVVGGRLLANRPFDSIMLFDAGTEPALQRAALTAGGLVALAALAVALLVGVGAWRVRRTD